MKKFLGEIRFGASRFNCRMINIAKKEMCTSGLFRKQETSYAEKYLMWGITPVMVVKWKHWIKYNQILVIH